MAAAAATTIVQVDQVVPLGDLDPETVVTPGIFVVSSLWRWASGIGSTTACSSEAWMSKAGRRTGRPLAEAAVLIDP